MTTPYELHRFVYGFNLSMAEMFIKLAEHFSCADSGTR